MHDWQAIGTALARGCTLRNIGEIAGVGQRHAARLLRLVQSCNVIVADIEPRGRKRWRLTAEFVLPADDQWTSEEITLLRTATVADAAKLLGVSERTITRERRRLGIEPPQETQVCAICGSEFNRPLGHNQRTCGEECREILASRRDDTDERRKTMRERGRRRYMLRKLQETQDIIEDKT